MIPAKVELALLTPLVIMMPIPLILVGSLLARTLIRQFSLAPPLSFSREELSLFLQPRNQLR